MKSAKQILIEARNLISDKTSWIKGCFARNERGNECSETDPRAICWCAAGALENRLAATFSSFQKRDESAWDILSDIVRTKYRYHSIPSFNDDVKTTHTDVLAAFDAAIAAAPSN